MRTWLASSVALPLVWLCFSFMVFSGVPLQAGVLASAPASAPAAEDPAIQALLAQQTADWNRGDLDAFARGYKTRPTSCLSGERSSAGMTACWPPTGPTMRRAKRWAR